MRISWGVFAISLLVAVLFVAEADRLAAFGVTGSIYYMLLILLGLCTAAFLFGAMRSHAKYEGKSWYGTVKLGGPVVVFVVVVFGGAYLGKPGGAFPLVVRVHGPSGPGDVIRVGTITVDLGTDRRTRQVNENGEAHFNEIPAQFVDTEVRVIAEIDGYRLKDTPMRTIPSDHVIYLEVVPNLQTFIVQVTVLDANNHPVAGVAVTLDGWRAPGVTDQFGTFGFNTPLPAGKTVRLIAQKDSRVGYNNYVTLTGPLTIPWRPKP